MWDDLEWNPDLVPPLKLGLHIAQIIFAFVVFCLEISVFRAKDASIVGRNGWTFGVCFLSIPAWIYLSMAPRFPRTRKLANPYAMAIVDGVFTIMWLSAFATQASYNSSDLCGDGCGQSKAIVGLGFFVFLFFAATTFLSLYTVKYWKWNDHLPGYDNLKPRTHNIDPDKAAFSLAPHDEEAYAPVGMDDRDHDLHSSYDNPFVGGGGSMDPSYSDHLDDGYGRRTSHISSHENPFEPGTAYNPAEQHSVSGIPSAGSRIYAPPSVHDELDHDGPAKFPAANYERVS
ncbi:hypothetical protein VTK73DRAFT_7394 [Phialemonium thermophilum]|uniref:MARVEL domain-containing protein n=1 Tax=Phialemonium thermophilum TaxID=223376 RepID=A0ABR3XSV0_9PEZI